MPKAEANEKVRALQEMMGARADGMWGAQTSARFRAKLEDISARSGIELKGGKFDAKAFQQALDRNQIKPGDIAFVKAAIDMEQARQDNRGNTVSLSSLYNPNASVGKFAARPEGRPAPVPLARPEAPVPVAKPERTAGVKPSEPTANDRGTGVFYEGPRTTPAFQAAASARLPTLQQLVAANPVLKPAGANAGPSSGPFDYNPEMAQLIKDMGHTGTEYAADGIAKIPSFTLANAVNMIRLQNGEPANFSTADAAKLGLDSSRAYDRTQEGLASLMADTAAYLKGSPTLPKSDLEEILKASRQTDLPVATLPAAPAVPVAQARFQPTQPGA